MAGGGVKQMTDDLHPAHLQWCSPTTQNREDAALFTPLSTLLPTPPTK